MPVHNVQTWDAVEEEHVRRHFRKHDQWWQKDRKNAAKSCVRRWQKVYPDKADNVKIDDVIKFRELLKGAKHLGSANHKSRVPDWRHSKGIQNPFEVCKWGVADRH